MSLKNLKFSVFEGNVFLIKEDKKIDGMTYFVVKLNKHHLKGIVECVDLTVSSYPIPRNLRERLEKNVLPRFYEINDIIKTFESLPNNFGIEISKLNKEDILYGLESSSIQKLLVKKNYKPQELIKIFY